MLKSFGDFSARLQGPAGGMASVDWLQTLNVHVWTIGLGATDSCG